MDHETARELTAAYALDALDAPDEREFEAHLRRCASCREEVNALGDAAAGLAYGLPAPAPPPGLRDRVLAIPREDRGTVVAFRRRREVVVTSAAALVAVAASIAAVGFGLHARALGRDVAEQRSALSVLTDPRARQIAVPGTAGNVVVAPDGKAALVVSGLAQAPSERTYQLWVISNGTPRSAGLFDAGDGRSVVPLRERVRAGDRVAVTVEPDGGSSAPTSAPLFEARV